MVIAIPIADKEGGREMGRGDALRNFFPFGLWTSSSCCSWRVYKKNDSKSLGFSHDTSLKLTVIAIAIGENEGGRDMRRGEAPRDDSRSSGLPILTVKTHPRPHGPGRGAAKRFSLRALEFVVVVVLGGVKRKMVGNDWQ